MGKVQHMATRTLQVQDKPNQGVVLMWKDHSNDHTADLSTEFSTGRKTHHEYHSLPSTETAGVLIEMVWDIEFHVLICVRRIFVVMPKRCGTDTQVVTIMLGKQSRSRLEVSDQLVSCRISISTWQYGGSSGCDGMVICPGKTQ